VWNNVRVFLALSHSAKGLLIPILRQHDVVPVVHTTPAAFHFFPQLEVKLLLAGGPSVNYWDYIMLAEYGNQETFCRMAVSKEYADIVPHKAQALEDAQAYLSTHLKI
jgi:hypothetical protein